jgi:cytochrome P450
MASLEQRISSAISEQLGEHSREVFAVVRRLRPLIATQRFGLVTRADDVRDVLADYEHFGVPNYNTKMTDMSGPFILGLDNTPLYKRDHAALRAAIRRDDVPALASATLTAARERVAAADGQLDVVREFVDPTVDRMAADYFGTPGPDTATQLRWSKVIFQDVFLNVTNSAKPHERALEAAAQWRPHLDAQIAARRAAIEAAESVPDDVLTRLLRDPPTQGGLHAIAMRHNLIGLIAGWIPTVSKAFTSAIEELLRRPQELEQTQAAARAGDQESVGSYLFEALRFRPQTWALVRTCTADQVVARGTRRATTFHAGCTVLVTTQSAMFDPRAFPSPNAFRPDRPFDSYLHFGHGLHTCFGREINRVHLPALATALLEGPRIERAPGGPGRLTWEGTYPKSLTVRFAGNGTA